MPALHGGKHFQKPELKNGRRIVVQGEGGPESGLKVVIVLGINARESTPKPGFLAKRRVQHTDVL